ncbi:DUF4625 domain-containing protein [Ferruginibacter sp. SUN106]|uniref:DUF4625 domain-containing protein n=1 Tax=Ferruginibacter sp. SUN106 TaxID=2978348 RepID=UPI003D35C666
MKKIVVLSGLCLVLGCKKNETPERPVPVIVVNTPSENQHFVKGDTIRVTGNITCTTELIEVAVHMTNLTTNFEFFHNHFSGVNTTSYNFSSKYGIPDLVKASYKVEVEGNDKDGNSTTKEIIVTVN